MKRLSPALTPTGRLPGRLHEHLVRSCSQNTARITQLRSLHLSISRRTTPQPLRLGAIIRHVRPRSTPPPLIEPPFVNHFSTSPASSMASIPTTMKGVEIAKTGDVDVLDYKDLPVPTLAEGQILVRNAFAGINFIDTYFRTGLYKAPSLPMTLGREAAGEVVAVHPSVTLFQPGARVVFMTGGEAGTYAEYTALAAEKVVAVPDGLGLDIAAAAFLQGLTAVCLIRESAEVKPGQWTLVYAAAGGVGALMVQILVAIGAKVIAVAGTEEKCAKAKEMGAGWALLSGSENLVGQVKEITGGHGIDAIFDGVGKATFDADLEMIAVKGHLVSFGNASGAVDPVNILRLGPKNVKLLRPVVNNYLHARSDLEKFSKELFDFITSGQVKVAIHEIYPLDESKRAQTDIASRKTMGKLLLKCT